MSFRYKILLELAESLALSKNTDTNKLWAKLEQIVNLCPVLPDNVSAAQTQHAKSRSASIKSKGKKASPTVALDDVAIALKDELDAIPDLDHPHTPSTEDYNDGILLLREEGQEALLALGHFLLHSKGTKFADRLLPYLLNAIRHLPFFKFPKVLSKVQNMLTPDNFAYHLITITRDVALTVSSATERISSAIDGCLAECHTLMTADSASAMQEYKTTTRVIYGIFKALAEKAPPITTKQQVNTLLLVIDDIMEFAQNKGEGSFTESSNGTVSSGSTTSGSSSSSSASGSDALASKKHPTKSFRSRLHRSIMLFVLRTLTNLIQPTGKPNNNNGTLLDPTFYAKCWKLATSKHMTAEFMIRSAGLSSNVINIFIGSVELATRCGLGDCSDDYQLDAFTMIAKLIKEAKALNKTEAAVMKIISQLLNSLVSLCIKGLNNSVAYMSVDALQVFIESCGVADSEARHEALAALSAILKADTEKHGPTLSTTLIQSVSNMIYATKDTADANSVLTGNRIMIVGTVTAVLNRPAITDMVLRVLISQFADGKVETITDALCLQQLCSIAHLQHNSNNFKEVLSLIISLYQNPLATSNPQELGIQTCKSLIDLASKLDAKRDTALVEETLIQVMRLFNKLGQKIQQQIATDPDARAAKLASQLGYLLSPLAQLVKLYADRHDSSTAPYAVQSSFRRVWFYCCIYGFVGENNWPVEWFVPVTQIAIHAPPLVSKKSYDFLETETELDSIVKSQNEKEKSLIELQAQLIPLVPPSFISTVKTFSFAKVVFLLSVYYLETLRLTSNSIACIFDYLQDKSLFAVPDMYECMKIITDKIFGQWLDHVATIEASLRTRVLDEGVQALFIGYSNRLDAVRSISSRFITLCTQRYPQVFWSFVCIRSLLNTLNVLHEASENADPLATLVTFQLPGSETQMYLPENGSEKRALLASYTQLARDWLSSALSYAPNIARAALEDYLSQLQMSFVGTVTSPGYLIAVEMSLLNGKADKRRGLSVLNEDRFASITQSVMMKGFHAGEVQSIRELCIEVTPNGTAVFDAAKMQRVLIQKLEKSLQSHMKNQKQQQQQRSATAGTVAVVEPFSIKDFNHAMHLATAYAISERATVPLALLQWIVWTPVYIFSAGAMQTASFCWNWLVSVRPDLELALLAEMYHAWVWTITQRIGLFSGKEPEGPEELAVSAEFNTEEVDTTPHRTWINFLSERYQVVRLREKEFLQLFVKFVMRSLEDTSKLTLDATGLGTRFRLLVLASVIVRHSNKLFSKELLSLLRERIYSAALLWFAKPASWYDPGRIAQVHEDVLVLQEFSRKLKWDKIQMKKAETLANSGGHDDGPAASDSISVTSGGSGARSRSGTRSIVSIQQSSSKLSDNVKTSGVTFSADLLNQIELLLILLNNEIERIAVWHNPQNKPDLDIRNYSNDSVHDINVGGAGGADIAIGVNGNIGATGPTPDARVVTKSQWMKYMSCAWKFSARLAVHLTARFPMPHLKAELERLTRSDPASVISVPEAVQFLVTRNNAQNNIRELRHLLLWAPDSLCTALVFLKIPYVNNAFVSQYAIRILRKISPDDVVFYLPQLVQALRYDVRDELKNYLIDAINKSFAFCHRLIWALKTEVIGKEPPVTINDKHYQPPTQADIEMSAIAESVLLDVEIAMNETQRRLYSEQFDFFNSVIKISGDLKPVEKEKRRDRMLVLLEQVPQPTENVYLPFNIDYQVLGIQNEKCAPMQSAAKSPILVAFDAKRKASHHHYQPPTHGHGHSSASASDSAPIATSSTVARTDYSLPMSTACIFKMGDDCRKDQLALQIIALIKRVFEKVNLPLYLYPYGVITTAPECGIIECVPNTMSRHQLGSRIEYGLYEYFLQKYGHRDSLEFQRARRNFIESMAAYSVVSYILNVRDRHNGNILVDEDGHVIHIDFGFIFDIAPGGDFGIESSPFKLSREMLLIMGETITGANAGSSSSSSNVASGSGSSGASSSSAVAHSEPFNLFVDLVIKGYLAARQYTDNIVSIVSMMLESVPCFKGDSIKNLRTRLSADMNEREAARYMIAQIDKSYENKTTMIYDQYQKMFEKINC